MSQKPDILTADNRRLDILGFPVRSITNHGNADQLMRFKKHFKEEIEQDKLGSGPTRVGPAKNKALNMKSD